MHRKGTLYHSSNANGTFCSCLWCLNNSWWAAGSFCLFHQLQIRTQGRTRAKCHVQKTGTGRCSLLTRAHPLPIYQTISLGRSWYSKQLFCLLLFWIGLNQIQIELPKPTPLTHPLSPHSDSAGSRQSIRQMDKSSQTGSQSTRHLQEAITK